MEEHDLGGSEAGLEGLVGETDGRILDGGEGEKLILGAGTAIPLRLGDLNICLPATVEGSCRGNRREYFMS